MLKTVSILAAAMAIVLCLPNTGGGFIVGDDVTANIQAPWNTAKASAMGQRQPGNMISSALADYDEMHDAAIARSTNGPTISDTEPDMDLVTQTKVAVIETLFDGLNSQLQLLLAALRASAGLDSLPSGTSLTDLLGNISSPV